MTDMFVCDVMHDSFDQTSPPISVHSHYKTILSLALVATYIYILK